MSKKIKLYGIDIESDDDIDYIPDEAELKEDEQKSNHVVVQNIQQIYEEMKKIDLYQTKPCTKTAAQIAKEVLEEQRKVQVKRVKFAGKSFLINDKGEIQEENIEQPQPKPVQPQTGNSLNLKELKDSFQYYREVIKKLTNRAKAINSIAKSKLDWKQYTTKEKLETQMEQKRKSGQGVLEKANQIDQTQQKKKFMNTLKNFRPSLPTPKYSTNNTQTLLKRTTRGTSADKKEIKNNDTRQSFKQSTPESKKVVNQFELSPENKIQEQNQYFLKPKGVTFLSSKSPHNRQQKSYTVQSDHDTQKTRNQSIQKTTKESTPVKSQKTLVSKQVFEKKLSQPVGKKEILQMNKKQPIISSLNKKVISVKKPTTPVSQKQQNSTQIQQKERESIQPQIPQQIQQQSLQIDNIHNQTLHKTSNSFQNSYLESNQAYNQLKYSIEPQLSYKEQNIQQQQKNQEQIQSKKSLENKSTQDQKQKQEQISKSSRLPTKSSHSPSLRISTGSSPNKTLRKNSPPNSFRSVGQTKILAAIARPMFKNAKYFMTSLSYFLKDYYKISNGSNNDLTKIESTFLDQLSYFKVKYVEHFNISYNSIRHCEKTKAIFQPKIINLQPPKKPPSSSQQIKTLVFDLDETLIHCNDINDKPTDYKAMIQLPGEPQSQIRYNVRPNCQQILKVLSQYYELILFTASYKEYADKILEVIDPENCFSYRFYNDSCVKLEDDMLLKDLRVLGGRKLQDIAIIDNNAYSYFFQLDNGIPIINFEDNKKDQELIYLADYLINCESSTSWLANHKQHFKNYIFSQCQTFEDCLKRFIK